ncbi:hypothetical protein O3G_MSEX013979 [Manduca sexta]|uniref:Uncharacterized protein n=1 Tax=Manduca sexta TaxID=7130 RepID=A0A922CZB8_MANSE|nr:hypothetical protein O3G_MSEX013979 [Manduca sexta]
MAMVVYLVAVLPSASAQSPSAPDVPHSALSQPTTTEHAGALLALIDHILTPAMVSNLNDDTTGVIAFRSCPIGCCVQFGLCMKCNPEDDTTC